MSHAGMLDRWIVDRRRPVSELAAPPADSALRPVPGDAGMPVLGHSLNLFRRPDFTMRRYRELGPVSWVRAFGTRIVSASGPDATAEVLVNKDKAFSQQGWSFLVGPFVNRGLLMLDFEEHLHHRRLMQAAFTAPRIEGYLGRVGTLARRVVPTWQADTSTAAAIYPAIRRLTLDVATEVFMAAPAEEASHLQQSFVATSRAGMAVVRKPVPGGRWAAGVRGRRALEEFYRRELPAKRAGDGDDLFSGLCHARDEDGERFTDEDVVNHMIFVMMAATDSTTTTLTSVMHQLGAHPVWQERVRAECEAVADPTMADLDAMTDLDLVIKEALRLVAPLPTLARRTVRDTELQGHFLPKDTLVFVSPGINHMLPEYWTAPETFDPERFAEPRREDKSHRYAWVPFGGGVHKCLGMRFGVYEVKALLHRILTTYRWTLPEGYRLRWDTSALPVPADGLRVHMERLQPAEVAEAR